MKKIIYLLPIFVASVFITGCSLKSEVAPSNNNANLATQNQITLASYASDAYGYSVKYPASWDHRAVVSDVLASPSEPYYADYGIDIKDLQEFGSDSISNWNQPYSSGDKSLRFSITVYEKTKNILDDSQIKADLGFSSDEAILVKIGDNVAEHVVKDDTNQDIFSARLYMHQYLIQKGNFFYKLIFSTATKEVFDENQKTVDGILNSFIVTSDLKVFSKENRNYTMSIPSGWDLKGSIEDAINTTKFGSSVSQDTFVPQAYISAPWNDSYSFMVRSYTIDKNLSVSDVYGLMNVGDENCRKDKKDVVVSGMSGVSFVVDTDSCPELATETAFYKTIILKNVGDSQVFEIEQLGANEAMVEQYQAITEEILSSFKYEI